MPSPEGQPPPEIADIWHTRIYQDVSSTVATRVIEQHSKATGELEAKFSLELTDEDTVILKVFDKWGKLVTCEISYDTAHSLQSALSDSMDEIEVTMGVNI